MIGTLGKRLRQIAVISSALCLVGGCSGADDTGQPTKSQIRWPPVLSNLHFLWSAEPNIDLVRGPAVIARAYIESGFLVSFGNSTDYLYPGFDHAVAPNQPLGSPASTVSLWPEPRQHDKPLVGTALEHILRVDQTGRDVTVVVCYWTWGLALEQPSGMYQIQSAEAGAGTAVSATRLSLTSPVDSNDNSKSLQQGPSLYANTDVFGGWRVVGSLAGSNSVGLIEEWPEVDQDLATCAIKAPETLERRQFLTTGEHPRSDFPTLPASPGWPAQTQ
jgi:hypothetical protein